MNDDMSTEPEDERETELSSISAIFPELLLHSQEPFSASIDIPVTPSLPLQVAFPEASDGVPVAIIDTEGGKEPRRETHLLSHLPSIHLEITLPEGYPATNPPSFKLSTSPQWLSGAVLDRLVSDGLRLWEEFGHGQVVYAYIDHLQQAAESTFGILGDSEYLQVSQDLKISLLDFDIKAKRAAFEKETFDCGVCLDPKKGTACHRMLDCGHVFCRQCLQDFYNNAITEGDMASVRCLAPNCAKKRGDAKASSTGRRRKPRTHISPSELLQIPIDHDMVKRYVTLKHKAELESDKTTIYCPRKWCQGAARSRKHKKPSHLLEEDESSEEESETEKTGNGTESKTGYKAWGDLLAVCEDCTFAFCSRCFQGWHGEFTLCTPRKSTGELTEEDKASMEYLKLHTTPCPTCAAPAQKTHGCNHMICFRCNSHFCYLCSAWLEPSNPYQHYNTKTTACFMRLWELEGGDGDDVGIGFMGGQRGREEEMHVVNGQFEVVEDAVVEAGAEVEDMVPIAWNLPDNAEPGPNQPIQFAEPVAREGPLVLRINQLPPQPPAQQRVVQNLHNANLGRRPHQQRHPRGGGGHPEQRPAGGRHVAAAARRRADQIPPGRPPPAAAPLPEWARQLLEPQEVREVRPPERELGPHDHEWVENFVRMALNDEEDQVDWDSDDEDNGEAWQIPVR